MTQLSGLWYVHEKGHWIKGRPFETELHFAAAYLFLSLSQINCIEDGALINTGTFQNREGNKLSYRIPLPTQHRRGLEQAISAYEEEGAQNPAFFERKDVVLKLKQAREQLANGIPMSIDEKTGILVETKLQEIPITVEDFRWLDKVPNEAFAIPKDVQWDDQSEPWPESDFENCVMVLHDPIFAEGGAGKPQSEGYVLNLKTEELRRVPFRGFMTLPGCFLKDRQEVILVGFDPVGGMGLVKVNLQTGRNEGIDYGAFNGGIILAAQLSPDGKKIATMRTQTGDPILNFRVQLIDLKARKAQDIGKPRQIGAPFSWLPDSDGLILKRFEPTENLSDIEPRILCRLGVDGELTDLRPGDSPVVLRKSRKILYEDNDTRLWHTCDLDGSHPELFAGGLKGYATPSVSPDESKIIFGHYKKGNLPRLVLFDLGKSDGKPLAQAEGFTSQPIWR